MQTTTFMSKLKEGIDEIKNSYKALIAAFAGEGLEHIQLFKGCEHEVIASQRRFELAARTINTDLQNKESRAAITTDDKAIERAKREIVTLPNGNNKLGAREIKGQIPSSVLLPYGLQLIAIEAIDDVLVEVPAAPAHKVAIEESKESSTPKGENPQAVKDIVDYAKKADFLRSASEGMRSNIHYINVAEAIKAWEEANPPVPTNRQLLEQLMPTVEITDDEVDDYVAEAKGRKSANAFRTNFLANSDDNKKRQLAATAILLGLTQKEENQSQSASLIWEYAKGLDDSERDEPSIEEPAIEDIDNEETIGE